MCMALPHMWNKKKGALIKPYPATKRQSVLSVVLWDCCKPMFVEESGLEVGLPAFRLPMVVKCDVRLTCLRGSITAIPLEKAKHPLPTRSLRLLRAAVRSACSHISALNHGCIMPIPSLQLQKKPALCTEVIVSEQLWRLRISQQCVGSGAASLSAIHIPKMWLAPEKRFMRHICLRNPFLPVLLGIASIQSLPEASGSRAAVRSTALHYSWIMPSPSLQLQKKTCLTQRSRGFGHESVVSKICCNAVIVPSVVLCAAANPWTILEIELLPTVGWKWGCQPFSCPCSQNVTLCRKRNPFLPLLFGFPSIHSLPKASGYRERQQAPPALHYACIMLAQDPMPLSKILDLPLMQKSIIGLVTELWFPRFLTERNIGICFFTICHVHY